MKPRIALLLASAAMLLVALPLGVALALTGSAKYAGKTDDGGNVTLRLTKDTQHVKRFRIHYSVECDNGQTGKTYTDVLNAKVRKDHSFRASGTYTGSGDGSTNKFKLAGQLFNRKANGTFSLKATDAGETIHCSTGKLTWKVTKAG